ncbi:MAG TPA: DUF411 domain-containing protein [Herpetosiphonaceae bacterium]|nr:DUF411 domain-containing protein [Herpetosiphonaceae bacterium]
MLKIHGAGSRLLVLATLLLILGACGTPAATTPEHPESAAAGAKPAALVVYKSPTCSCCKDWNTHVMAYGFPVSVKEVDDVGAIKDRYAVPAALRSCHTAIVDGYVIEGHVPAADIERLLRERPAIAGLAVAGMPIGSPGMEVPGAQPVAYDVIAFDAAGGTSVFASH